MQHGGTGHSEMEYIRTVQEIQRICITNGGNYTVNVTAGNPFFSFLSNSLTINVDTYSQTVTGFTANTTTGNAPQGVEFNVTTINDNATIGTGHSEMDRIKTVLRMQVIFIPLVETIRLLKLQVTHSSRILQQLPITLI